MNIKTLDTDDHPPLGADGRRGICHISDVLPVVLARIATPAAKDEEHPARPADAARRLMPMSSTS